MPGPPPAGSQFLLASSTTVHQVAAGAGGPAGRLIIALPRAGTEQYAILGTGNRQSSSCVPGDCPYVTLTGSPAPFAPSLQAGCHSAHLKPPVSLCRHAAAQDMLALGLICALCIVLHASCDLQPWHPLV